jgi:cyclic beta-1,2-glucan synthetase
MPLNTERLQQKAHELALTDDSRISRRPSRQFLRDFDKDAEKVKRFLSVLQDCSSTCSQPAEEWLLDHSGLILEQTMVVRSELGKSLLNRLPQLRKHRIPRLLPVCIEYFALTDGELNEDSLTAYIQNYQEISPLTIAEIWAIPLFLRIALLRRLAEIVEQIQERREVCLFVERLLSQLKPYKSDPAALNTALDKAGLDMPLSGPLIVHLVSHLREWEDDSAAVREWLQCKLENGAESLDQIQTYEYQLQAAYQVQTGNLIGSLRKIERWNWLDTFEQMSLVEQILRRERAGLYPRLDGTSRDLLRKRVERLARRCRVPESVAAEQAVELAAKEHEQACQDNEDCRPDELPRRGFAAYYLLEADGMRRLQLALAMCGKTRRRLLTGVGMRPTGAYFVLLIGCFALALSGLAWWIGYGAALKPAEWLVILCALLLPASEWGVAAAHWLIECGRKPLHLLRYDLAGGIPEEAAAMVVIPVIWSTPDEVHELADRLELHYLANRDPNLHFALLGDFADAKEERLPEDAAVVAAAQERIKELNDKYASSGGSRFYFFQRRRLWNPSEGVWMGWERKRGKLVEFVELLRGSRNTTYEVVNGDTSVFPKIRYIITLDADTQLPAGSARRMIATLHLPYNRPRLNDKRTRVIEGYGVLQPRIGISYEGAEHSRLTSLWSVAPGIDPYAFAVSDPYQDGVGEGIFTGKGIFDVDVFAEVLCERIPENRVLSHDLLEGGFLRAGLLSDMELIDEQPATFSAFQKRLHRWVRGDWQLLCWLFPRVCDRRGTCAPVDLSVITRWQMIDNLRRSLLTPALFAILCLGLTVLPGNAGKWLLVVLATLFLPLIRHCLTLRQLLADFRSFGIIAGQAMVLLAVLPFQSVVLLDAIGRTLYRLFVSKRHLLEWVSSAEVERRNRGDRQPVLLGMKGGYVLILLGALAAAAQHAPGPRGMGAALVVYWALAPSLIVWLNKPPRRPEETLAEFEQKELRELAERIWQFFEDYVTGKDHWLPPDNVQIEPPKGTAHRTSPTNIGLYMASALAACDFGFIDRDGLALRLERTLETLERLDKWNGHLYNWYDTVSLEPLPPKYVSSVDSGNFICCLVAVKEGLEERLGDRSASETAAETDGTDWPDRGQRLIARIEALIEKTDFAPLFDPKTKLFSLGYDATLNRRDPILYDLMASESRQTSFIAIALGQIPADHWNALGRTMTRVGRRVALLSWSGTMFEYLMPCLLMRTYRRTVWRETCLAVVNRQMQYARQRGVPFGISESGYYAFDYQMNYQYRAFGVPGLGFQRGLERDLVIAPYAAILALPYAARPGLENLRNLEKLGARGTYGFFEAVDFTSERLPKDEPYMVVRSFMAHHQGMSMLALANVLLGQRMIERFHRDKRVQAVELLLQERIPARPKIIRHPAMKRGLPQGKEPIQSAAPVREHVGADGPAPAPEIGVLSNGNFTTMVTDSGGGFILFGETAVTRWKEDPVQDDWGNFFYIRDVTRDKVWSPGFQPCRVPSAGQRVQFSPDRVKFLREDDDIRTSLEICVSPEWNADIRRLTLTNTGSETRFIEVTTYYEIVLASPSVDDAHPAFSKLFVETAYEKEAGCLLARRRPRNEGEKELWAAHALLPGSSALGPPEVETDRSEFIGRGYTRSLPQAIRSRLRGTVGAVTDPVFAMRQRLAIEPGEQMQLFAMICIGDSKEEVMEIVSHFSANSSIERTFQLAWTRSQIELRHLRLSAAEAADFQRLAGRLLYRAPLGNEQQTSIADNRKGQSGLWPFGISGDLPILLVRIADRAHMPFIARLLKGYEYLRRMGIRFDLVLLNESAGGYQQPMQDALQRAVEDGVPQRGGQGGVLVLNRSAMHEEDVVLLTSVARLVLRADGRSLKAQIRLPGARDVLPALLVSQTPLTKYEGSALTESGNDWLFFNGWGGFAPDGREYRIALSTDQPLPAPWINVLANPLFGCLVSERGTGYTWWRNSRECKLTTWSNDPVLDPPGETGYFRDEQTGEIWTLFPFGAPPEQTYEVTHARGFTRFRHERSGVLHEATVFVPAKDPVKIVEIRVKNVAPDPRRLSFTYYAEWVLGVRRETNAAFIVTEWDERSRTLQAHNTYQEHFRNATAFLGIYPQPEPSHGSSGELPYEWSWTGSRREFIGRSGTMEHPDALRRERLSGKTGPCYDPCGAVQIRFALEAGAEQTIYVVLGCGDSRDAAVQTAEKYCDARMCREALEQTAAFWEEGLGQIVVSTPCPEMDLLLNGWLLYQVLGCRMWARSAFYQAGGAYGFRDQLQDSLALLHTRPDLTRAQILLHAAHQYEEGDVQHWWHEETGRGIRTRFSDDYLWLPYAVARYVEHTEDDRILDETVHFLHSEPLRAGEHERYEETRVSPQSGTVLEHSLRAIDLALQRLGEHGLPLIGIGDWNDGMSRVGAEGRGESVWLAWFLCDVLDRFADYCRVRGHQQRANRYRESRNRLSAAVDEHAWDGQWYRRAFTDAGQWIGSIRSPECRIDAIAQSWSVLSGAAPAEKARQAMQAFDRELVDRSLSAARLLTPPFDRTSPSPGYIQGYPPGIRENGGQYTHGAIWSIIAWCLLGEGEKAVELFRILNPITHTKTSSDVRRYAGEPYAMAADVYTAAPHEGRAGWTWYTGSAGWMYQAGIEWILGLRRKGTRLYIRPCIPEEWPAFAVRYRYGNTCFAITVRNGNRSSEAHEPPAGGASSSDFVKMDAENGAYIELVDDGQHHEIEFTIR